MVLCCFCPFEVVKVVHVVVGCFRLLVRVSVVLVFFGVVCEVVFVVSVF